MDRRRDYGKVTAVKLGKRNSHEFLPISRVEKVYFLAFVRLDCFCHRDVVNLRRIAFL